MMRVNSGNHTVFITNILQTQEDLPSSSFGNLFVRFLQLYITSRPKKVPLIVKTPLLLSKVFAKSKTEKKIKSPNPL